MLLYKYSKENRPPATKTILDQNDKDINFKWTNVNL